MIKASIDKKIQYSQVQTIKKAVTLSIVPENKGIKRKAKARILVGVGPQGTDVEVFFLCYFISFLFLADIYLLQAAF